MNSDRVALSRIHSPTVGPTEVDRPLCSRREQEHDFLLRHLHAHGQVVEGVPKVRGFSSDQKGLLGTGA